MAVACAELEIRAMWGQPSSWGLCCLSLPAAEWQQRRSPREEKQGKEGWKGQATICCYLGRCLATSVPCISAKGRVFSAGTNDFITCLCLFGGVTFNGKSTGRFCCWSCLWDPGSLNWDVIAVPPTSTSLCNGVLPFLSCLIWLSTDEFTLALSLSLSLSKYMPLHTL